jgi:multidrug resistance efflux pump
MSTTASADALPQISKAKLTSQCALMTGSVTLAAFAGHVDPVANATGSRLSLLPLESATGNYVKIVQRIPVKIVLDPEALASGSLGVRANVDAAVHTC